MADRHGTSWMDVLPWTMLGRHTAYQPDLEASPAELAFGDTIKVPGDLIGPDPVEDVVALLDRLRTNAAQPPPQTSHHRDVPVYMPEGAHDAKSVYLKLGKPAKLGPCYDGPYKIEERIGESCLKLRVGNWASGEPRYEVQHWNNCYPSPHDITPIDRAKRGRKPLNPEAQEFVPSGSESSHSPIQKLRLTRSEGGWSAAPST